MVVETSLTVLLLKQPRHQRQKVLWLSILTRLVELQFLFSRVQHDLVEVLLILAQLCGLTLPFSQESRYVLEDGEHVDWRGGSGVQQLQPVFLVVIEQLDEIFVLLCSSMATNRY